MKQLLFAALIAATAAGCHSSSGSTMTMASSAKSPMNVTSLSSPDIAGILKTANTGEIQQAQAALPHLTSQAARDFANMMITDHTAALNEAAATFDSNHIVPRDASGQVGMLKDQTRQIVSAVNNSGTSGDAIYIQSQINIHQNLLTLMDTQLVPSAHQDLANLLLKQREAVAAHLDRARQVLASLP
jgi:putative membrane protein